MALVPPIGERDRSGLVALRAKVRARLDELWARLEGQPGFERIRSALVIYFDERVMGSLPEYLRLSWPLLQTEFTGSTSGGDDFYRLIDVALDDPRAPSLVFEINRFCLAHGFRGRYTNDLERIAEYERKLLARIEVAPPRAAGREPGDEAEPRRPWPLWAYYVVAAIFVVGLSVALTVLSNSRFALAPLEERSEVPRPLGARS